MKEWVVANGKDVKLLLNRSIFKFSRPFVLQNLFFGQGICYLLFCFCAYMHERMCCGKHLQCEITSK